MRVDQNFVSFLAETKKNGIPIPNFLSVAAVSQKIQIDFSGSYSKSDFVDEEKLVTKQVNCWGAALYKGSILASHPAVLGPNPGSAKIFSLYCSVLRQNPSSAKRWISQMQLAVTSIAKYKTAHCRFCLNSKIFFCLRVSQVVTAGYLTGA